MKKLLVILSISALALFGACGQSGGGAAKPAASGTKAAAAAPAAKKSAVEQNAVALQNLGNDKAAEVVIKVANLDAGTWPQLTRLPLPEYAGLVVFKNFCESMSNGKIAVDLYPNNELGDTKATMEMCQQGSIQMVVTTGTAASLDPKVQVLFLPYVFKSTEIAWDILDNSKYWKDMTDEFAKKTGMYILGTGENGIRHFTNNKRPIHSPKDMKGLKFRVMQSPIYVSMVQSLGAQATPLASGEIYTACQTGVVDGEENPIWNIVANKWYEVQKYICLDGHVWSENFYMANKKWFDSIKPEYQHLIRMGLIHGVQADRACEDLASRVLDYQVIKQYMKIYKPNEQEMQEFVTGTKPTYDWLRKQVGAKVVDDFLATVKTSEKKLGW
jgi:C4-dicarboxylate-binding protein DctP